MKIRIGSRGSNLALTQTKWVADKLREKNPSIEAEIIIIRTKGDMILDKALDKIGDKGLFVKELEDALLDGVIDFAVHSMKDMPSEYIEGLSISSTPVREDNRDVLILKEGYKSLDDIPLGGTIGTGSKRRCFQIKELRNDMNFYPIRGNIETRIAKLRSMNLDGIILAAAGIHRLNLNSEITQYLDKDICIPAPAQGALAIQYRTGDKRISNHLETIKDESAELEIIAERSFLKYTNGGCHVPVGAYTEVDGKEITLYGLFGKNDGSKLVRGSITGDINLGKELGKTLAERILKELI